MTVGELSINREAPGIRFFLPNIVDFLIINFDRDIVIVDFTKIFEIIV